MKRIVLSPAQREGARTGRFVHVDLGGEVEIGDTIARSVVVGTGPNGLRAYANVCRHHAIPLDLGMDTPMADDGVHLLCHQHGALYRPDDGYCVAGPCAGQRLFAVEVAEVGDEIVVTAG